MGLALTGNWLYASIGIVAPLADALLRSLRICGYHLLSQQSIARLILPDAMLRKLQPAQHLLLGLEVIHLCDKYYTGFFPVNAVS